MVLSFSCSQTMFKYSLNSLAWGSRLQKSGNILSLPWSPITAHYVPCSPATGNVLLFFPSRVGLCFYFLLPLECTPSLLVSQFFSYFKIISCFQTHCKSGLSKLRCRSKQYKDSFFCVHAPHQMWVERGARLVVFTQGPGFWSLDLNTCLTCSPLE